MIRVAHPTRPDPVKVGQPLLELAGVRVDYGGIQALRGVDLTIARGEIVAMIGANGAGKTTLLRAVLGLQRPNAGSIRWHGQPPPRRNRSVGYVPQKVVLDPDMPLRARDLVALGLDGDRFGMPVRPKRRAGAVDEMLAAVDAEGFADARVGNLSGGEQQRVLIAHALISRPGLLLLDEPLANLDLRSSQEVVALLGRVADEQGVAVLLSAHEINPLLPVMDRVIYLAGGRAVSGTTEEVIRADVLSDLYRHHVDVIDLHGRILVIAGQDEADGEEKGHDVAVDVG